MPRHENRPLAATLLLLAGASVLGACSTIGDDEVETGLQGVTVPAAAAVPSVPPAGELPGWTEWRGPRRDAVVRRRDLPEALPEGTWPEAWRVTVGTGIAGLVVADGRLYAVSRQGDRELVTCHDARSGATLWTHAYEIAEWDQHLLALGVTDGPLATPTLVDGRLYTVGVHGTVHCLDASSGAVRFRIDAEDLYDRPSELMYGHATSPLVRGGRLWVAFQTASDDSQRSGSLVCLHADTGAELWRAIDEEVTYTSPVWARIHGVDQVVVRTWKRLVGLEPTTGEILWEHTFEASGLRRDCATPLVVDDVVWITNYAHGTLGVKVSRDDTGRFRADRLFRSGGLSSITASPVLLDGHLFGLHRRGFFACIDAATGERRWVARAFGEHLSTFAFGSRVLALDDEGTLALIEPHPDAYRELGSWQVGEYTWAHPAIDADRFYFRDGDDLVALPFPEPSARRSSRPSTLPAPGAEESAPTPSPNDADR